MDVNGTETGDEERSEGDRLGVLRSESRDVLDHQIELVRSIDEKAMWVVRTAVVATSVVVTGAGIAGEQFLARNWAATAFAMVGIGTLLFVSVLGSVLFAVSRPPFGPSPWLTEQLWQRELDGESTQQVLLHGYSDWIAAATEEADDSARAFTVLQGAFVVAVYALALSGVLLAVSATVGADQSTLAAIGTIGTLGLALSLWTINDGVYP